MTYTTHTWSTGETITADRLNAIEGGIANATDEITSVSATTLDAGSNATASLSEGDEVVYEVEETVEELGTVTLPELPATFCELADSDVPVRVHVVYEMED